MVVLLTVECCMGWRPRGGSVVKSALPRSFDYQLCAWWWGGLSLVILSDILLENVFSSEKLESIEATVDPAT